MMIFADFEPLTRTMAGSQGTPPAHEATSSLQRDDPPPIYRSDGAPRYSTSTGYQGSSVDCETTPLVRRGRKRKNCFISILCIATVLVHIVIFVLWGPSVKVGLAIERQEWERELRERRLNEQSRIHAWEAEWKTRRENEHLREEKWHREEEERQRLGLYWGNLEADQHCTAYETRNYWARLLNTVPYEYNWLKPCQDIPIDIHGKSLNATICEIKEDGSVYGHWRVDFDEPACTPYWEDFRDKGCVAPRSGRRRFQAHLQNIHYGENGDKLCYTTPHDFYGMHFAKPLTCIYEGDYKMYGVWEADDDDC